MNPVQERESAVNALNITEKMERFPDVFSLKKARRHMTEALKIL